MSNLEQYAQFEYYAASVVLVYILIRIYNRLYRRSWRWTFMDRGIAMMQASASVFIIPFYVLMILIVLIDRDFFHQPGMDRRVKW